MRYVYMCVCMYVCIYVCIYVHVCVYVCVCIKNRPLINHNFTWYKTLKNQNKFYFPDEQINVVNAKDY